MAQPRSIPSDSKRPRILVIDDEPSGRDLLARMLEKQGLSTVVCGNGREAMQLFDGTPPDLVLCDYEMPEFNGAEVCELIRSDPRPSVSSLPIILLTAHTGEDPEIESLEAGANDFVTKPVNLAVLRARIETQLRLHALRKELEEWRRSHEFDLEAAQVTQRAILPSRQPAIEGWETASHFDPVIQVGGDIYDWIRLAPHDWLFWIADATGHGASAALITTLTKLVFRHAATEASEPKEILRLVNSEFYSVLRGKSFMTAACMRLDAQSGRLIHCGAGHPPLLVRRRTGPDEFLASHSPPIGILPEQTFVENSVTLAPRDLALLYTDGLYSGEAADGVKLTPYDVSKLLPRAEQPAREMLLGAVERASHTGVAGCLPDDVAAILLRRTHVTR